MAAKADGAFGKWRRELMGRLDFLTLSYFLPGFRRPSLTSRSPSCNAPSLGVAGPEGRHFGVPGGTAEQSVFLTCIAQERSLYLKVSEAHTDE
jgi:hypothetical protein